MKKYIQIVGLLLCLAGCSIHEDDTINSKANLNIVFDISVSETKAVKKDFVQGDKLVVFFDNMAVNETPKYAILTKGDGTDWNGEVFNITSDEFLEQGSTMSAVYFPFGEVSVNYSSSRDSYYFRDADGFPQYSYFLTGKTSYTAVQDGEDLVIKGGFGMTIPEGFVQFFIDRDGEKFHENGKYRLIAQKIRPAACRYYSPSNGFTLDTLAYGQPMWGYVYDDSDGEGLVFSGQIDTVAWGSSAEHRFVFFDPSSPAKTKVFNKMLKSHNAVKLDSPDSWERALPEPGKVDFGSFVFADRNLGADDVSASGFLFAWGEISPFSDDQSNANGRSWAFKETYSWSSYLWATGTKLGTDVKMKKYHYGFGDEVSDDYILDNSADLNSIDDPASAWLGPDWMMPLLSDWRSVYSSMQRKWQSVNNMNGMMVSRDGVSMFLPASGMISGTTRECGDKSSGVEQRGEYWSRNWGSHSTSLSRSEEEFLVNGWNNNSSFWRYYGCSVRPVYIGGVAVSSVSLSLPTMTIKTGEVGLLTATIEPEEASGRTIFWKSSDESVATVSNGEVHALHVGQTTITASAGGKSASCLVTVEYNGIPIESVSLDKTALDLNKGETATLVATVLPADATNKNLSWESSDESVVTVDQEGKVTAVGGGQAIITVAVEDFSAKCTINVTVPVESISIGVTSTTMEVGKRIQLTATVLPEDATDKSLTWSSSVPQVAAVTGDGMVTAISTGVTTITASSTNGSVRAACTITVDNVKDISVWDGSRDGSWYYSSENNEYHITSAAQLADLSHMFVPVATSYGDFSKDAVFYLECDIDLGGLEWTPIGQSITISGGSNIANDFAGVFEGNGHTIKGLSVTNVNDQNVMIVGGLFGLLDTGAHIRNLSVQGEINMTTTSENQRIIAVGGIVGYSYGNSTIVNCHSDVNITFTVGSQSKYAGVNVGGVGGYLCPSEDLEFVYGCSSSGIITVTVPSSNSSDVNVGGIVGTTVQKGTIAKCSSSSSIVVNGKVQSAGGIAGHLLSTTENCIFIGNIATNNTEYAFVGGIAGLGSDVKIRNCIMVGAYTKNGGLAYLAPIIGVSSATVENSYYLNSISTSNSLGTAVSKERLTNGVPLDGFSTEIWSFPVGEYPCLKF